MSYDIRLIHPVTQHALEADAPHQITGGTYAIGGTRELWLNITYNYSDILQRVLGPKGIRTFYGLTGAQSLPLLEAAIAQLGDDVDDDYWQPTDGNAKTALCGLRAFAQLRPDGIWKGD